MKVAIIGDVHWSKTSSILVKRGESFTLRLENLIDTINWCEKTAEEKGCKWVVYLGDFFDRSDLNAQEITALKNLKWNTQHHSFIVGNHEAGHHSLVYKSTDVLSKAGIIEYQPKHYPINGYNVDFYLLPYITEDNRKPLKEYFNFNPNHKNIIFSHNDLRGIRYGMYESQEGFTLSEINECCDLFINGHLHNGTWVNDKILNLGNITGQNFTEDAFTYKHQMAILDTDTLKLEFIENPYSLKFYKIDINNEKDLQKLNSLRNNAVVSFRCLDTLTEELKEKLNDYPNIIESKTVIYRNYTQDELTNDAALADLRKGQNHLQQFADFVKIKIGKSDIIEHELSEVCK